MDRHTALAILSEVRAEKRGDAILDAVREQATQGLKSDALGDIGRVALFGLGAGAAGRGALGLYSILKKNMSAPKPTGNISVMPLPVPGIEGKKRQPVKMAGFWGGDWAKTKQDIPWYPAGMMMGGLAAAYGGWKAVDAVLKHRKQKEMESELEQARGQFNQALVSGYEEPLKLKAAADQPFTKLGADLDRLFEAFEKSALFGLENLVPDSSTVSNAAGRYGLYAVPAALIAGYAAYKAGAKGQRATVLRKALARRARRQQASQPAELYARPVPAGIGPGGLAGEDEEI